MVNRVPWSSNPTLTVKFTNQGDNNESNVKVSVSVKPTSGKAIAVTKTIGQTKAKQPSTVNIPLGAAPPANTPTTVTVAIAKVPGEKTTEQQPLELHGHLHEAEPRGPGRRPLAANPPPARLSFAAVDDLSSTTGIVALVAGGLALIALIAVLVLVRSLRRLRADQRAILGGSSPQDLVTHAAELDRGFGSLNDYVGDVVAGLDARLAAAEGRLDGAVAFHGLVRYDAYNEMSGRQSTSIALLDSRGSGIVISSIHHRDQARLYAKQVVGGRAELELSPEEEEAMRAALAGEAPDAGERRRRRSPS